MPQGDLIIGIDAGTSVIKAVAFDLSGRQIGVSSVRNRYRSEPGGIATQSLTETWGHCAAALRGLGARIDNLAARTAALSVTGQGDGTWLVGADNVPVGDAWLWLDARAAPTVERLAARPENRARFEATGTGLNTCQQGAQMAHMTQVEPERLDRAEVALHCKDWLYLNLTGMRATDPSEASFTFGNFRTRAYDDAVIDALGLTAHRDLLPEIIDGTRIQHPLTTAAAAACGLAAGTPVSLGHVDMVMTALGAGVYGGRDGAGDTACSILGSTGVHLCAKPVEAVHLNAEGTGYVIVLPVPGMVTQVQTNMAAALNIDWILKIARDVVAATGGAATGGAATGGAATDGAATQDDLVGLIDHWLHHTTPATLLYHPYISDAGERGPFVNAAARAGFTGLSQGHGYGDLVRAVVEGLGMAMRDCYAAMGGIPGELRLSGGAARSAGLRAILAAALDRPLRFSLRDEAGAAGAAMMAAVAIGACPDMDACLADWVTPLLEPAQRPDPDLSARYARLFPAFVATRQNLAPSWHALASARQDNAAPRGGSGLVKGSDDDT